MTCVNDSNVSSVLNNTTPDNEIFNTSHLYSVKSMVTVLTVFELT